MNPVIEGVQLGSGLAVSTETDLAALDPTGLALGSECYVTEENLRFALTSSGRTVVVDPGDTVDESSKTWVFANGAFTADDVGREFTVAGATDEDNNGTFTIATVEDGTTITSEESPGGDETFTGVETLVVHGAALSTNEVVGVAGSQNLRWLVVASGGGVESVVAGAGISVDATDPANPIVSALPSTASTTLVGDASTIDVTITGGDGLYTIELETATSGAITTVALRVNAAPLTSPKGQVLRSLDTGSVTAEPDTGGNVFYCTGYNPTSIRLIGQIAVRSGAVCVFNTSCYGQDASRKENYYITGQHSPGSPLSSIGVSTDGSFSAGAVLRCTKSGA